MDNSLLILLMGAAIVVATILMKRLTLLPARAAQQLIAQGAKVIDVRSKAEHNSGRLPGTLNVPLDELSGRIGSVATDRDAPLLLHCLSGTRSALARAALKRLGYRRVHNLGSLARARRILEQARSR